MRALSLFCLAYIERRGRSPVAVRIKTREGGGNMRSLFLITKSLLVIVAVLFVGIKVTGAYFSDQEALGASLATAQLTTSIKNEGAVPVAASSMLPGSSTTIGPISFQNTSDVDIKYQITSKLTSGDQVLYDALKVKASRYNGTSYEQWYDGSLSTMKLDPALVPYNAIVTPGSGAKWQFNVYLPSDADNSVAGKTTNFEFDFNSTQVSNPGWN